MTIGVFVRGRNSIINDRVGERFSDSGRQVFMKCWEDVFSENCVPGDEYALTVLVPEAPGVSMRFNANKDVAFCKR